MDGLPQYIHVALSNSIDGEPPRISSQLHPKPLCCQVAGKISWHHLPRMYSCNCLQTFCSDHGCRKRVADCSVDLRQHQIYVEVKGLCTYHWPDVSVQINDALVLNGGRRQPYCSVELLLLPERKTVELNSRATQTLAQSGRFGLGDGIGFHVSFTRSECTVARTLQAGTRVISVSISICWAFVVMRLVVCPVCVPSSLALFVWCRALGRSDL
jgi:hypothetical protein